MSPCDFAQSAILGSRNERRLDKSIPQLFTSRQSFLNTSRYKVLSKHLQLYDGGGEYDISAFDNPSSGAMRGRALAAQFHSTHD